MVRSHSQRRDKYNASLNSLEIFLKIKKQRHESDKPISVQTIKDMFIVPLIARYELDARRKLLAEEAWRKLYFLYYRTKQQVTLIE